ncbi:MAG: hypothetical protein MMC33_009833 [Icmadophila ericetorum]|nr:hypothetical protein [Icmadophila ericetorum]
MANSTISTVSVHTLEQLIKDRHSTRKFLPRPVPEALVHDALDVARYAPSNSNIQPWRMVFISGPALDRLKTALVDAAESGTPNIPPLPDSFKHFRSELGREVYGVGMGITHDDKEGRRVAVLRNFEFFGAPLAAIVCMHQDLGPADALSVGMYLQTLLLALTDKGVDSCVEVSVTGYPDVLRKELGLGVELLIICGLAIGYSDPEFPANLLHIGRVSVEETVSFVNE